MREFLEFISSIPFAEAQDRPNNKQIRLSRKNSGKYSNLCIVEST